MTSSERKKLYWSRKRRGLCPRCGRARDLKGVVCSRCRPGDAERYRKSKAAGECPFCGSPAGDGRVYCKPCISLHAAKRSYKSRTDLFVHCEREGLSGNLVDPRPGPDEDAVQALLRRGVAKALGNLRPRDRIILVMRFGLYDGKIWTLDGIASVFCVTRERIRQLECRAIRRLQHPENARFLKGIVDPY